MDQVSKCTIKKMKTGELVWGKGILMNTLEDYADPAVD